MDTARTLSDTKRSFYTLHTRPINSIYRQVVEEMLVEMHLLSVNADFHYEPIYALGVVTSFDRFMQGYQPERDKESIFNAICQAIGSDPQQYRQDAERLLALVDQESSEEVVSWLTSGKPLDGAGDLNESLQAITNNPKFKYSRLFAIGLYTLLERADEELVKDEKRCKEVLKQCCETLHISFEKMEKDLDLYRGNLEKMEQARSVLEDTVKADRKQREKRAQKREQAAASDQTSPDSSEDSNSPKKDEASSFWKL
ncbi:MAG: photosystem II biogenesis protein Psp29 [Cyanobacteria bacterium QH_8_48_120]|nr:MAG: photosystem II biogenesis protein Psp29 [Cyanobacteria bacterium QH_1_48_107]PSO63701.1 MAG: photosystem II biogenesis protein Psp29 [Cyanobacteria bacterium QH_6_48_35]PSO72311.1 MAG: photosystem II biogenesis protein Psp29 [Cyanobacteria bacterium QH_8_48_120]